MQSAWGARARAARSLVILLHPGALRCIRAPCTHAPARAISISANDSREGELLELENGLWRIVKREFSRTAAGRAYVQMELKHLTEGTKLDKRFRSEDMLEKASLDTPARLSVMYTTGDVVSLMHQTTFEQTELPLSFLGDKAKYIVDGLVLSVESYKGIPAIVELPARVTVKVVALDAGGGDAASVVPVGADGADGAGAAAPFKVRVPKFVKEGDRLVIDTESGKYLSREQ